MYHIEFKVLENIPLYRYFTYSEMGEFAVVGLYPYILFTLIICYETVFFIILK